MFGIMTNTEPSSHVESFLCLRASLKAPGYTIDLHSQGRYILAVWLPSSVCFVWRTVTTAISLNSQFEYCGPLSETNRWEIPCQANILGMWLTTCYLVLTEVQSPQTLRNSPLGEDATDSCGKTDHCPTFPTGLGETWLPSMVPEPNWHVINMCCIVVPSRQFVQRCLALKWAVLIWHDTWSLWDDPDGGFSTLALFQHWEWQYEPWKQASHPE